MKLKQSVADFKVEEINSSLKISKEKAKYKVYSLEKSGMETFALLRYLARQNKIPFNEFGFAGLKDKHAVAKQYLTVPSEYELKVAKERNFSAEFLGYTNKPIKLGELDGNRFEITARDIKKGELAGISQKAQTIALIGVPNYFDSQRFGSVTGKEFIAEYVFRKDYEDAVKLFLTGYTRHENSRLKEEKRRIAASWSSIKNIEIKDGFLAGIVDEYKKTGSWLEAYKRIPRNLREMFVSAYQSYLWNECVKEVLREAVGKKMLYNIEYNIGSLIFYKSLSADEAKKIPASFRTISHKIQPSGFEARIISRILNKEGVSIADFDIKGDTGNFLISCERSIIVKPSDFLMSAPEIDELNDKGKKNRLKLKLSFFLPKGSYATIVTKRVFNR